MGGGDLNLKKSWHPQTIRNVERVWKAEQKATAETKKIEQLQRELLEERAREDMQRHAVEQGISKKKSDRLEWMYATPGQVDREQYLLGKTIDKHVDPLANDDKETNNVPGASFSSDANANTPVDLAAKVRDDPLFLIKKKEEEKKKEFLHNPLKMKHLRQMLQENLDKSTKKKEKKRKKDKKEKRRKAKKYEESSDERQKHRKRKHDRDASPETSKRDSTSKKHSRHRRRSSSESPDRPTEKHKRDTSSSKHRHNEQQRLHSISPHRTKQSKNTSHSRLSRSDDRKHSHRRRSSSNSPSPPRQRSRSPVRNGHKNSLSGSPKHSKHPRSYSPSSKKSRRTSPPRRNLRHESDSPPRKTRSPSPRRDHRSRGRGVTKKMSAEELERRREEMLSNAEWRNDQRTTNVKKHREIEKEEAEAEVRNKGKSAKFLSDMKVESFSSDATASVSDRIKRNINSLQRTTAALDTFLVRK